MTVADPLDNPRSAALHGVDVRAWWDEDAEVDVDGYQPIDEPTPADAPPSPPISTPTQDFVHLHVHSEFSLLDGLSPVKRIVDTAKHNGMHAVALTDHGNLYGAIDFYSR